MMVGYPMRLQAVGDEASLVFRREADILVTSHCSSWPGGIQQLP